MYRNVKRQHFRPILQRIIDTYPRWDCRENSLQEPTLILGLRQAEEELAECKRSHQSIPSTSLTIGRQTIGATRTLCIGHENCDLISSLIGLDMRFCQATNHIACHSSSLVLSRALRDIPSHSRSCRKAIEAVQPPQTTNYKSSRF